MSDSLFVFHSMIRKLGEKKKTKLSEPLKAEKRTAEFLAMGEARKAIF